MIKSIEKIAIIGAGPAGISAALQLERYAISPILFEANEVGGALKNSNILRNYPGFVGGISSTEILNKLKQQIIHSTSRLIKEKIIEIDYNKSTKLFQIKSNQALYLTEYLMIATGTQPNKLAINIPDSLKKYIHPESHTLSPTNSVIAITGSGDAAYVYAIKFAKKNRVLLFNRGVRNHAIPALITEAKDYQSIEHHYRHELAAIKKGLQAPLRLIFNREQFFEVDYLITAIGRKPNLSFLTSQLQKKCKKLQKKNRLHFIGDIKNGMYRQLTIAVADGTKAAIDIYQAIKERDGDHLPN